MADVGSIDFRAFIDSRRTFDDKVEGPAPSHLPSQRYAFAPDRTMREKIHKMKVVETTFEAAVRLGRALKYGELLGHAVKVGPEQFPRVHRLTRQCAETLGIATPTVYIVNSPVMNAATFGTNEEACIMVHSALVDAMSDAELMSVIGHECGHVHNGHVVYLTAMSILASLAGVFRQWLSLPARLAILDWARNAEITCDRASLLCSKDLEVSTRALTKLALGSSKLYDQLNMEAFIDQYREGRDHHGRYSELGASHPFLPKRVLAMRHFAESELYRAHAGAGAGGLTMSEVDERVLDVVGVR
jgi:Zn-dependent protease with chaperone function